MPELGDYYTIPVILSFEGIDKQVNDALGKAIEPAVKKAGEKISTSIADSTEKGAKAGGKKLDDALNKAADDAGKKAGKKVDDALSKASKDAAKKSADQMTTDMSQAGTQAGTAAAEKIQDGLNAGVQQGGAQAADSMKTVGENLAEALKQPLDEFKGAAKDWAAGIAADLGSGNIVGATDSITHAIEGSTNIIANLGEAFGIQTDSLRDDSASAVDFIGNIGGSMQNVVDKGGAVAGSIQGAVGQFSQLSDAASTLSGKSFGKGTKFGDSLDSLVAAAGPIGLTVAAASELDTQLTNLGVAKFTEIPGSATWFLHQLNNGWPGITDLKNNLENIFVALDKLGHGAFDSATTNANDALAAAQANAVRAAAMPKVGGHRAGGGPIAGPGGPTSDIIPIWASNGEHMLPADEVDKLGGQAAVYQWRQLIRAGAFRGFAGGGEVGVSAGAGELKGIIQNAFPGVTSVNADTGRRDGPGEHASGNALDIMLGSDYKSPDKIAMGDSIAQFLLDNAGLMDVKWVIWNDKIYKPGQAGETYGSPNSSDDNNQHRNHVHVFLAGKTVKAPSFDASQLLGGTPTSSGGGSTSGTASGGSKSAASGSKPSENSATGQLKDLLGIAGSGLKETLGIGSWLPDIADLMPVKMAETLLGAVLPMAGAYQQGQWTPGGLLGDALGIPKDQQNNGKGASTSNSPFGLPDVATPPPPGSAASGMGSGPAPGPGPNITIDQSVHGNVGSSPAELFKARDAGLTRAIPRIQVGS